VLKQKIEDFNTAKEPSAIQSTGLPKGVRDEPKVDNILDIELDFIPTQASNGGLVTESNGGLASKDNNEYNLIDLDFTNPNPVPVTVTAQPAPVNDDFDLLDFDVAPAQPVVQTQITQPPPSDDLLDFEITPHNEPPAQQNTQKQEDEFSIF